MIRLLVFLEYLHPRRRAIAAAYDARGTTQIALRRSFHTTSSLLRTIVLLPGWLWAWGGLTVGNCLGYLTGRLLLSKPDLGLAVSPTLLIVVATRPVPVLAEAVTIAAGAGRISFGPFLLAILIGNAIFAAAMAGNGAALLPDRWSGPGLALPLLLPILAWGLWLLFSRYSRYARHARSARGERSEGTQN